MYMLGESGIEDYTDTVTFYLISIYETIWHNHTL